MMQKCVRQSTEAITVRSIGQVKSQDSCERQTIQVQFETEEGYLRFA